MAASDDMVREILVRVKDGATLFRCAMVCKGWRSLVVADDSFLRRCLPEDVCGFSGFITQPRTYTGCPPRPPCFLPAPRRRPVLGTGRCFLSSFFSGVPTGYLDYAVPLVSRRGLLLVRLELQHPDRSGVALAVCDLLDGTVHELPRLEHYWDFEQGSKVSGYALLTAADCWSSNDDGLQVSRSFKVLIVSVEHRRMHYNLHSFSSADEDSGWNTCSGAMEDEEGHSINAMLRQHNAVVLSGAAHWLLWGQDGTYSLDVSAETGHVSATKMMNLAGYVSRREIDKPYLTVSSEGNLTLLSLKRDGRVLKILTSHDSGRSFQTSTLMLRQVLDQWTHETNHVYTCLADKCDMVLVKVNHRRIHLANVKTGVMWEVPDWPCSNGLTRRKVVPVEIDWPAFFANRLAVATL
jgi:hypothetical protein